MEENVLDALLSAAVEELEAPRSCLKEADIFSQETNLKAGTKSKSSNGKKFSVVHSGDTDSSDDEDNRYYQDRKYNQYGRDVKHLLELEPTASTSNRLQDATWKAKPATKQLAVPKPVAKPQNVRVDPIFGLQIVNPLISSGTMQERMLGREAVPFSKIQQFVSGNISNKNWVIGGVIANNSAVRTSQKGSQYLIWTLSDLKNDIKTVSMFLFSSAYKEFWKTTPGTVVGVLNPSVLDKKDGSKDEACLSVDNSQKIMILGQSKDLGTCRSTKKNGEKCTAIVNVNRCEFCIFHIKKEYEKCSKRQELQSSFAGRGLTALRNKVLGKNEVFYAGKSFMAIPAKKSQKLQKKDENRLMALKGLTACQPPKPRSLPKKKAATNLDILQSQRLRDIELLQKLGGLTPLDNERQEFSASHSAEVTLENAKSAAVSVIAKLKAAGKAGNDNSKDDLQEENETLPPPANSPQTRVSRSIEATLEGSKNAAVSTIAKLKMGSDKCKKVSGAEGNQASTPSTSAPQSIVSCSAEVTSEYSTVRVTSKDVGKVGNGKTARKTDIDGQVVASSPAASNHSQSKVGSLPKESLVSSDLKTFFGGITPTLSGGKKGSIDLSAPITPKHVNRAKLNALKYVQKNGPLQKGDPNNVKNVQPTKKRPSVDIENLENGPKKKKIEDNEFLSDRFKKMMATTSKHMDLLEQHDNEEQEKYFNKLEAKERMEEKMVNTFKVACKAVRCLKCKYTNFSASQLCKDEKHPLRVFDATKRFFKCGDCGNRTVCLEVVPIISCKNCGLGKWERTGMMKEKNAVVAHTLSIRGGEQKFVNSVATNTNINLLVPSDD